MGKVIEWIQSYKNVIICSYKNCATIKAKFPNKRVAPDMYCPDKWLYYVNRAGEVRHYLMESGVLYDACYGNITMVMAPTKYKVKL